jgi:hypothetical protein
VILDLQIEFCASFLLMTREQRRLELWTMARSNGWRNLTEIYNAVCKSPRPAASMSFGAVINAILEKEFPGELVRRYPTGPKSATANR